MMLYAIVWNRLAVEEAKGYLILFNDQNISMNVLTDGKLIDFLFGYKLVNPFRASNEVKEVKIYIQSLNDNSKGSIIMFYNYVIRLILKYHNYLLNPCYSCYYYWTMKQLIHKEIEEIFGHICNLLVSI